MSSEMRMHDDEGRCLCGCTENCAVAAELRGEITRLRAVVNRMVEEDNERFASEALLARTEAGADGAAMLVRDVCEMAPADPDAPDTVCIRVTDLTRIAEQYTHPQDASGDAEDAARWRHVRKDGLIWRVNMLALAKDDIDILFGAKADAAIDAAMQAKEAK